jgi:holo-[acyl-carrier protein] synthase
VIVGVGTDMVSIPRIAALWQRHGERVLDKLLSAQERLQLTPGADPTRLLAKRFAAKEALAKAMGTGLRAPLLLTTISVAHDALGKPSFVLHGDAADEFARQGVTAHLSLSDEHDYALAFVVLETV